MLAFEIVKGFQKSGVWACVFVVATVERNPQPSEGGGNTREGAGAIVERWGCSWSQKITNKAGDVV